MELDKIRFESYIPLYEKHFETYLKDKEDNWHTMPNNVVGVLVNPQTGKLANKDDKKSVIQYYLKGTEPSNNYNLDDAIPTIKYEE